MQKRLVLIGLILTAAIITGYGCIVGYMMHNETSLVFNNTITQGTPIIPPDSLHLMCRPVCIVTPDSVHLAGWVIPADSTVPDSLAAWMLFFHGNGRNIGDEVLRYGRLHHLGFNILTVDYRGFGESGGTPSEVSLLKDGLTWYRYVLDSLHANPTALVVYGFSMGTCMAIDLAAKVPVGGLVVEGGMSSIMHIGQMRYPWLPVSLIMKNRFMSIERIGMVAAPILVLHSRDDQVIPIVEGQLLFDATRVELKKMVVLSGEHVLAPAVSNDVYLEALHWISTVTKSPHIGRP